MTSLLTEGLVSRAMSQPSHLRNSTTSREALGYLRCTATGTDENMCRGLTDAESRRPRRRAARDVRHHPILMLRITRCRWRSPDVAPAIVQTASFASVGRRSPAGHGSRRLLSSPYLTSRRIPLQSRSEPTNMVERCCRVIDTTTPVSCDAPGDYLLCSSAGSRGHGRPARRLNRPTGPV